MPCLKYVTAAPYGLRKTGQSLWKNCGKMLKSFPAAFFWSVTALLLPPLAASGLIYRTAPANLAMQSAWGVAMAAEGKPAGDSASLLPVYLRLSQAERERQARLNIS